MKRIYENNLICLVPVYVDNIGDCTRVFLENQASFILEKTITSVLRNILAYYMVNLGEIKKIYGKFLTSKNLLPLAFDGENILVPFKARRPISHNDKAFGYFNLKYYKSYNYKNNKLSISFTDGQTIGCISKLQSFKNHLKDGEIVKHSYIKRKMSTSNDQSYLVKDPTSLNILIRELEDLKKTIEKRGGPI